MKLIFKYTLFLVFYFNIANSIFSQDLSENEIQLINYSNTVSFDIKFYPVSMVFNGDFEYDLGAKWPYYNPNDPHIIYSYIGCAYSDGSSYEYGNINSWVLGGLTPSIGWSLDKQAAGATATGALGYGGIYKIEFSHNNIIDSFFVEFDYF